MRSGIRELRGSGPTIELFCVMEIQSSSRVLLIFLSFLFYLTSSLYVGDYRHPMRRTFLDGSNDHSSRLQTKNEKPHESGRRRQIDLTRKARDNEIRSRTSGSFVNCVININDKNQPLYNCTHSADVVLNWTRQDNRLTATFSTNLHCPKRRSVRNKGQSLLNEVGGKWKKVVRNKRRTVYHDDAGNEDVPQVDEDKDVVPEVDQDVAEEPDNVEDSEAPPPADIEEEAPDEKEDKEEAPDVAEEVAGPDIADEEVPGNSDNDDGDDKGNQEDGPDASEAGDSTGKDDIPPKEETDDNTNSEEPEKVDETTPAKEDVVKPETAVAPSDDDDDEDDDPIIDVEFELPITDTEMPLLTLFIEEIIYEAVDYLLALVEGSLRQRLRNAHVDERFNRKVKKLAASHGNDTTKATVIMKKKIREQFGKSYQQQIVRYLKQLREGIHG